jgi:hypothetical protein
MTNPEEIQRSIKQYRETLLQALDRLHKGEITEKEAVEISKAMGKKLKDANKALKEQM